MILLSYQDDWNLLYRNHLVKLMNELPLDEHISEFASSGPKSYGYLQSRGKHCVKVKCISFYKKKREKSTFEALRALRYLMLNINVNSCPPHTHTLPQVFDNGQAMPIVGVMIGEHQSPTFLFCLTRKCCQLCTVLYIVADYCGITSIKNHFSKLLEVFPESFSDNLIISL